MSKRNKRNMYMKVRKTLYGDELWISPAGTEEEYFLTDSITTLEEAKNYKPKEEI